MQNVLIIGATSAIASEVARVHADRGDRLFLLGRDAIRLLALASSLGPSVVASESGDFDELGANDGRVARAVDALGGLDVAVIAHGWLGDQVESERSIDHAAAVITTNFTSVVSFAVPIVNSLEARGAGSLVVLSSVAGDRGRPRNYTYGAAKGALNVYLQGLRTRLYRTGVTVTTLKLGPVDSPMTHGHTKHMLFGKPPAVARSIVRAIDAGRPEAYIPAVWGAIIPIVKRVPEAIFQKLAFLSGR